MLVKKYINESNFWLGSDFEWHISVFKDNNISKLNNKHFRELFYILWNL